MVDELLHRFDQHNVRILDGTARKIERKVRFAEDKPKTPILDASEFDDDDAETQAVIEEAIADSGSSRRIDDPVRMYLTQMGEIPLLTREQEIRLAKKIEITRMIFRRKVLETDYCLAAGRRDPPAGRRRRSALRPHDEDLHRRGRTPRARSPRASPSTSSTVRKLLELNRDDWDELQTQPQAPRPAAKRSATRSRRRRRKIATLLEELSLRTSKISR